MKNTSLLIIFTLIGFLYTMNSCTADKASEFGRDEAVCDSVYITYNDHIKNIFDNHCISCHDGSYQFSLKTFNDINRVKAKVYEEVMHYEMPIISQTSTALSEAQIDSIHCWQLNNYPEN